jgi:micrococcal nuclease
MGKRTRRYLLLELLLLLVAGIFISCAPTGSAMITVSTISKDITPSPVAQTPQSVAYEEGKVTGIIDGHTIEVDIEGTIRPVRYIGIDTVLMYTFDNSLDWYAQESYQMNSKLVAGKLVRLEKDISEKDKFGDLLRYVWIEDNMVNAELVRTGYAQALGLPPDIKYYDLFLDLQQEAKLEGKGLWNIDDFTVRTPIPGMYVGDKTSKKYHSASCALVNNIRDSNRIFFSSVANALARGYIPCKLCKPPDKLCGQ